MGFNSGFKGLKGSRSLRAGNTFDTMTVDTGRGCLLVWNREYLPLVW